jgi:hypothetical protein
MGVDEAALGLGEGRAEIQVALRCHRFFSLPRKRAVRR